MRKEKILIVEDERLIALEIESRLERLGYEVCAKVVNANEALNAVRKFVPDIVLMDIRIEGDINGIETAKQIQSITKIPIIYLTAYSDQETLDNAKETLPYGYLIKPVQERDLRITIEIALHKIRIEKELEEIRKELEESELKNRTLLNAIPDLIFTVNKEGLILDFNSAGSKEFLLPPSQFINKKLNEVLPSSISENAISAIKKSIEKNSIELVESEIPVKISLKSYEARITKLNDNEVMVIVRDVTGIKKTERDLIASERKFKRIAENISDALIIDDLEGNITFCNEKFWELYGIGKSDLKNFKIEDLASPEYKMVLRNRHNKRIQGEVVDNNFEFVGKRKDGKQICIEASVVPIYENNKIIGTQSLLKDITEKKKSANVIKRYAEKYIAIKSNKLLGFVILNENGIIEEVNETYQMMTGYPEADIINNNIEKFDINISAGLSDRIKKIMKSGQEIFETKHRKKDGEIFDVEVNMIHLREQGKFIAFFRDITERKKNQMEMSKLSSALEQTADLVFITTKEGVIEYVNPAFELLTGYAKNEAVGNTPRILKSDINPPGYYRDLWETILSGKVFMGITINRKKNGELYYAEQTITPIKDSHGNIIHFVSTCKDITERMQMEAELRKSEERFKGLYENATIGIYSSTWDDKILMANPALVKMLGYNSFEELQEKSMNRPVIHFDQTERKIFKSILEQSNEITSFESKWRCNDGTAIYVREGAKIVRDKNGNILCYDGTAENVTEQNKAKETLLKERNLFSEGPVISIIWSPEKYWPVKYVSKNVNQVLGYTPGEFVSPVINYADLIHPDDIERISKEVEYNIANHIDVFEQSYRLRKKDGTYIWIFDFTHFERGKDDKLIEIRGYIFDQTEYKIAEEAVKENELKYRTVADWTYDWEYWLSPEEKVIYMSPSVERITGYKVDEFINNPKLLHQIIFHEDKEIWKNHVEDKYADKNPDRYFEIEFRIRTKFGSECWIQHICRHIYDDNGNYIGIRTSNRDITENKRALEIITKLSTAVEQSPLSIMITNKDGKIEYVNEKCCEITGYKLEEMIGYTPKIFKSGKTENSDYKELWNTILTGNIWKGELLNIRKNGEHYWESQFISPILNKKNEITNFVSFREDITERKSIEKELKEYRERLETIVEERTRELIQSEEKFRALAENSEDTIMRFNRELQHLYVNPVIEKQTGIPAQQFIGKSHRELGFPEDLVLLWETTLTNVFEKKEINRIEFELPNGIWIDWILIPQIEEDGEVKSVITSGRDITAIKKYEKKVQEALDKEKELNELKSKFISTASHEFRTPLSSILSSAQMIKRYSKKWDTEKLEEHHNRISESVKILTELMDEVLLISKAENGRIKINPETVGLEDLINKHIEESKPLLKREQYFIYKNKAGKKEILIDQKIFHQVLGNLLSNAIKYSNEESKIMIESNVRKDSLIVTVKDEGIGIDNDDIPYIFDPFYRTKNATQIEGTGLGLNIVKRMVEVLKGRVKVESQIGKGSTFEVVIPLKQVSRNR